VAVGITAAIMYRNLMWEIAPPQRGFAGEQVFSTPVDVDCIKAALQREFGDVHNFVFHGETVEDTFNYYDSPDGEAWILLGVADTPGGTRVSHSFIGHGDKMPQSEFPPAIAAMRRATAAIHKVCKLDLSRMKMKEVGQRVDALH
jgi:hypothetical protein